MKFTITLGIKRQQCPSDERHTTAFTQPSLSTVLSGGTNFDSEARNLDNKCTLWIVETKPKNNHQGRTKNIIHSSNKECLVSLGI